jgi:hypothetical protein
MARMLHRRRFARNQSTSAGVARLDGDLRPCKGAGAPPRRRLTEEGHDASTEAGASQCPAWTTKRLV